MYLSVSLPRALLGNTRVKALVYTTEAAAHLQKATLPFPYTQMQVEWTKSSDPTLLFTTISDLGPVLCASVSSSVNKDDDEMISKVSLLASPLVLISSKTEA